MITENVVLFNQNQPDLPYYGNLFKPQSRSIPGSKAAADAQYLEDLISELQKAGHTCVIDRTAHSQLLAKLETIATLAGIEPRFILSSMKHFCGQQEVVG